MVPDRVASAAAQAATGGSAPVDPPDQRDARPPTDDGPEPERGEPGPARRVVVADLADTPLSVDELMRDVTGPTVGGVGLFVGIVRDADHGHPVRSLDYTAHPTAAAELRRCATEVAARHAVESVAVRHRTGHLEIGDLAVVVVVGARHRGPALVACHELIDQLKAQVPVWKEQHFDDGSVEWVGL